MPQNSDYSHWPIHPKPLPDELTSSWIIRIAIAQGLKLESLCRATWGHKLGIWNRDIDKCPQQAVFDVLSAKTLTPMDRVLETHLSSYAGKLYRTHNCNGNQNWILPIKVYHRLRRAYGQQFCPHCLVESMHLRKHWRLALVTCCEVHGNAMLDRCPNCEIPMHFHRDDMGHRNYDGSGCPAICFNCAFDLRKAPTVKVPEAEIIRQKQWLAGIAAGSIGDHEFAPDYFDVLRHMTTVLLSCYKMTRDIGKHAARAMGVKWVAPNRPALNCGLEGLPLADRRRLLEIAAWLLDEWPNRLIDFCKEHEIWSAALTKELPNAPAWYKTVVDENLKREIWKGKPDPTSKRAKNWKPIHKVLKAKRKLAVAALTL